MFINNREILKAHYERELASDLFSIDNRKSWTSVFEESSLKPTGKNYVMPCLNCAEFYLGLSHIHRIRVSGLESWTGVLDWSTGLEYWSTGVLEC